MVSPEQMDDDTSEPPSPPKNTYKDPDGGRQRFLLELEFVQCLANPTYINRNMFTPWDDDPCFITGGCDHAVVLWREQRGAWKSRLLHRDLHSSSMMGVAGVRHKNHLVLSCGDDKRFVGFDARAEKATFTHRLDNRCANLLPNPCDVNLVMVHTR